MPRTLPPTMITAINDSGATPALALVTSDPRACPTDLADSGITTDIDYRTRIATSVDSGDLLVTYVDQSTTPTAVLLRRISDPTNPAQWTAAFSTITTGATNLAGGRIAAAAGLLRCCYQRASDHFPCYRDSTDDGLTWGTETVLGDGTLPLALSAPIVTDFLCPDPTAAFVVCQAFPGLLQGASALALTTNSGVWSAWSYQDPAVPAGDRGTGQITSIDFIPTNPATPLSGGLIVAGMQRRNTLSGVGVYAWSWDGSSHGQVCEVLANDSPTTGISWNAAAAGRTATTFNQYALACFNDDGSVDSDPHTRAMILLRPGDAAPADAWTRLCHFDERMPPFGASLALAAGQLYIVTGRHVWTVAPGAVPTDLAPDLLTLHVHEGLNTPTTAAITLANQDLQYLYPIYPGIQLALQLGYGADLVACHALVLTDYRQVAAGSQLSIELICTDLTGFLLSRISERFMALSSYTVAALAQVVCTLAGITYTDDASSLLANVVPCFIIKPGESYLSCLNRLADLYDLCWRTDPTPSVFLFTPNGGFDPTTWDYGQETLAATYGCPADLPTLVRVVGDNPDAWAEAWDASLLPSYGLYIYQHIADRLITTAGQAKQRAQRAIDTSRRMSRHAQLTVTLNPQHVPGDVVTLTDIRLGDDPAGLDHHHFRCEVIDTLINHENGTWHTALSLQEP
jgi:hypothetical protein